MTTEQKKVEEFMRAFGQEVNRFPVMPSEKIRKLRAKLILEEALETIVNGLAIDGIIFSNGSFDFAEMLNAIRLRKNDMIPSMNHKPDLKLIADGLADLHYVAYCGTGAACGIDMAGVFNAVHRSNMTKFWTEKEIASESFSQVAMSQRRINSIGAALYIVTDYDGKVIKSPSYTPANIQL